MDSNNSKQVQSALAKEVEQLQSKVGKLVMELEGQKKWQAILDAQEDIFF